MVDLLTRLRGNGGAVDIPEIMHEAADEIERLRAALTTFRPLFEDDDDTSDGAQYLSWAPTTYGELRQASAVLTNG